jgi:uncharacterized protein Yka (UPF0111/DUF47 family)
MPKETEFFPLLGQLSDIIINSSELLVNCLSSSNYDEALVFAKKIKEQEIKADMLTQQIFDSLNTTFITPFDREDIHDLADKLESVIDGINSSAKKIVLYYPDKYPT